MLLAENNSTLTADELACVEESERIKEAQIWVGVFMTLLCIVLATVMTFVAVKVKKLVWETDRIIPWMLFMMCLTLYSLAIFFVFFNILSETVWLVKSCLSVPQPDGSVNKAPVAYAVFASYFIQLPSIFLGVGAMLNLNKWCYFLMRILAFVKIGRTMHQIDQASSSVQGPNPDQEEFNTTAQHLSTSTQELVDDQTTVALEVKDGEQGLQLYVKSQ